MAEMRPHAHLNTRRGMLGWGARLAVGMPAVLAGLQLVGGAAHADDGDDNNDNNDNNNKDNNDNQDRGRNQPDEQHRQGATFSADLVPANSVSATDFGQGGVVADTGSGVLQVQSSGTTPNQVFASLRGATANTTYEIQFAPFSNPGVRESLGTFTTDARGDGRGMGNLNTTAGANTNAGLGSRVGVFVIRRGGADAFVTAA